MWTNFNPWVSLCPFKHKLNYMETNVPTAPSAKIAWEAMKAFIRGYIIQYASYKKKIDSAKLLQLVLNIKITEVYLRRNISHKTLK